MDKKTRYSNEELKEFEVLVRNKLEMAHKEYNQLKESISKSDEEGTEDTAHSVKTLEYGAQSSSKENLVKLAARQQRFINDLENALIRIRNGTYGICVTTKKLISKERLRSVPHTTHSIEAKLNR